MRVVGRQVLMVVFGILIIIGILLFIVKEILFLVLNVSNRFGGGEEMSELLIGLILGFEIGVLCKSGCFNIKFLTKKNSKEGAKRK
jgi:hypothetical protein